jgi:hypothetical protein
MRITLYTEDSFKKYRKEEEIAESHVHQSPKQSQQNQQNKQSPKQINDSHKELILAYSVNHMSELEEYLNNLENRNSYEIRIVNTAEKMLSIAMQREIKEIVFYKRRDITINGRDSCMGQAVDQFMRMCNQWKIKVTFLNQIQSLDIDKGDRQ